MYNPENFLNFLYIAWPCDPSLTFFMVFTCYSFRGVRVVVSRPTLRVEQARQLPERWFFHLPLVAGWEIFGVGLGIAGFCPEVPCLRCEREDGVFVFLGAGIIGILAARSMQSMVDRATRAAT